MKREELNMCKQNSIKQVLEKKFAICNSSRVALFKNTRKTKGIVVKKFKKHKIVLAPMNRAALKNCVH